MDRVSENQVYLAAGVPAFLSLGILMPVLSSLEEHYYSHGKRGKFEL
jgi:hypothetical protein